MNSGRERLHPPIDRHVIDVDTAFAEQFLDVAVGHAVPHVPAHCDRDHLARESDIRRAGTTPAALEVITGWVSLAARHDQRNRAGKPFFEPTYIAQILTTFSVESTIQ